MNLIRNKANSFAVAICSLTLCVSLLSACGGGGGGGGSETTAGIGGTGIAAGKVTGFGSIYVNGSIYNTDASQFIVDGESFPDQVAANLQIGMFVKLRVKTLDGKLTGTALEVVYDDEVQGPVSAISAPGAGDTQRTFNVFGQNVTVDETTTIFNGTTFLGLSNSDVVEISGFRTSDSDITASYVERKGSLVVGSELELRGTISGYTPPTEEFMLDGVLIRFDSVATNIEVPNGVLVNGLFVEVEGTYQTAPVRIDADEIEFEDEEFGDEIDEISLQGIISNYLSDSDFEIDGQAIDAGSAQFSPAGTVLGNGLEVEVEGDIVGNVLIADELEVREGEVKLKAIVTTGSIDLDPGNEKFEVNYHVSVPGTIVVNVDAQTVFEDEAGGSPLNNMSINDLRDNDFVKIEGQEVNGAVIAGTVKRIDPDDYKLEAAVDSFVRDASITILGIPFPVDPNPIIPPGTEFEGFAGSTEFFDALNPAGGDIVEIEDEVIADGVADEVELY